MLILSITARDESFFTAAKETISCNSSASNPTLRTALAASVAYPLPQCGRASRQRISTHGEQGRLADEVCNPIMPMNSLVFNSSTDQTSHPFKAANPHEVHRSYCQKYTSGTRIHRKTAESLLPSGSLRYAQYALCPPPSLTPGGSSQAVPPLAIPAAYHRSTVAESEAEKPMVPPLAMLTGLPSIGVPNAKTPLLAL